jgi:hypothetical protein
LGFAQRTRRSSQSEFFKFIYESFDVTFEEFTAKVNQESEFKVRELQVCQDLLFVNSSQGLDRFQFDQNLPSDNKIRSKAFIEALPAKVNRN